MCLTSRFRQFCIASTRYIYVGNKRYRLRGLSLNPLAGNRGDHDPWLNSLLGSLLLSRPGAVLDVGANIGQTMLKVLALDANRRYIGFEPQLACAAVIDRFIRSNRLQNFNVFSFGLSNENAVVQLQSQNGEFDSTASMVKGFRPEWFYQSSRFISVRHGDEVIKDLNLESVALIKIDVEGAELEVLQGLRGTIQRFRPAIIFEVLNSFLRATGQPLDQPTTEFRLARIRTMETLLSDLGYDLAQITPKEIRPIARIEPAVSADLSLTNYLASPRSVVG